MAYRNTSKLIYEQFCPQYIECLFKKQITMKIDVNAYQKKKSIWLSKENALPQAFTLHAGHGLLNAHCTGFYTQCGALVLNAQAFTLSAEHG